MDEERREHVQKMKKMEADMEQVFEMKVKEKMQKLKDSENDVSSIAAWSQLCLFVSFVCLSVCHCSFCWFHVHALQCVSQQGSLT